ncbi:MAG TPA: DNA polymerase III subunit [Gemmatimonadales bacterium]|nr:DNA polymerase III subunit [Gemmatimonadales bacterium]
MPLKPLAGHEDARLRLARALREDRLPQALLLIGPAGVGKQRLALWLAQLVQCDNPGDEPCGECGPCRKVLALAHPDVHWFVPIPRPKAGEPGKQMEEAAESLAEVMAERRTTGSWTAPQGLELHSVASVRLLQREASMSAVEGRRRIFIVGDAERLVPQESSMEAANALLKLLEEPPPGLLLILTAEDGRRLLPTIRSRTAPLRLAPLPEATVRQYLEREAPVTRATIERRVAESRGSIGMAMALDESSGDARKQAEAFLVAALGDAGARWRRVLGQAGFAARGSFTDMLDALQDTLLDAIRKGARRAPLAGWSTEELLEAVRLVQEARDAAQGNVNPQLIMAELAGALSSGTASAGERAFGSGSRA